MYKYTKYSLKYKHRVFISPYCLLVLLLVVKDKKILVIQTYKYYYYLYYPSKYINTVPKFIENFTIQINKTIDIIDKGICIQ